METSLNTEVQSFFKQYDLDDITIENIQKSFKNIHEENDYGGLLHAAVENLFPEECVLKFMKVLLDSGVNVNLHGEFTGYTFIHLALYGYTEDDKDYSYSTEFILKLIRLAKNYGFDVNAKDDDGDSLIHTALASEVYTGEVIPLLQALGEEYDVLCQDDSGNDISKALKIYKDEAKESKNTTWYQRLTREEDMITKYVLMGQYAPEEVESELNNLKTQLNTIISSLSMDYLLNNLENLLQLKEQYSFYLSKYNLFHEEKLDFSTVWNSYDQLLKKVVHNYLETISNHPSYQVIDQLSPVLSSLQFSEEIEKLNEIKESYTKNIQDFSKQISESATLAELEKFGEVIEGLRDEDVCQQLREEVSKRQQQFQDKIFSIQNLFSTQNLLHNLNLGSFPMEENTFDYLSMTVRDLSDLESSLNSQLDESKQSIVDGISTQIENILSFIDTLENNSVFENGELDRLFDETVKNQKKKLKMNRLTNQGED